MKTRKTLIAILAMAILLTMVAVVSCKKEPQGASLTRLNTTSAMPRGILNMSRFQSTLIIN